MALRSFRGLLIQNEGDKPNDGFDVVFPDFPGCVTHFDKLPTDPRPQAFDALVLHIEGMVEDGHQIPQPSPRGFIPDWLEGQSVIAEFALGVEVPSERAAL